MLDFSNSFDLFHLLLILAKLLKIVYESEYFIAVDKPPLWLSIPGRVLDERPVLLQELRSQFGDSVLTVHRLDYEVGGLILFARTVDAHRQACLWFEKRQVAKSYEALTELRESEIAVGDVFRWQHHLHRGKKRSFVAPHGKLAITEARVLARRELGPPQLHWWLRPHTGRSHQLRVHLAMHACPIIGDELYGSTSVWPEGGIALRSICLDFFSCENHEAYGLPSRLELDSSLGSFSSLK